MLFKNIGLIDENFEYKENMYVGTNCHRIVYIDSEPPKNEEAFFETYDGKGKVLMPAFYNAHGHSPMCLMRGYGENLPLDRWLNERIFPFEDKLTGDAVYWATVSLTTVGYGDIYPVTILGRLIAMISSLFGIAVVALPAGIITAGYMQEIQKKDEEQQE